MGEAVVFFDRNLAREFTLSADGKGEMLFKEKCRTCHEGKLALETRLARETGVPEDRCRHALHLLRAQEQPPATSLEAIVRLHHPGELGHVRRPARSSRDCTSAAARCRRVVGRAAR